MKRTTTGGRLALGQYGFRASGAGRVGALGAMVVAAFGSTWACGSSDSPGNPAAGGGPGDATGGPGTVGAAGAATDTPIPVDTSLPGAGGDTMMANPGVAGTATMPADPPIVPDPVGMAGTGNVPTPQGDAYVPCSGTAVPALTLEPIVTGMDSPIYVTSAPGDATDLYIALRAGTIMRVNGTAQPTEFFSLAAQGRDVDTQMEGGFLGFALHPDFDGVNNTRIFVSFTANIGTPFTSMVEEFTVAGGVATFVGTLFSAEKPTGAANHNGGNLEFGPDGFLYYSLGDGGGGGNGPLAQDLTEPFGSIMRFDVDNPDVAPAGNLSGAGEDTRIYHYGVRNPWRFSFDRMTSDFWIADVGQNAFEEVSVIEMGTGSTDFGWPMLEGFADFNGGDSSGSVMPIVDYSCDDLFAGLPGGNGCSVTGGYVYRGASIPGLFGRYLFADYSRNQVLVMTRNPDNPATFCDMVNITDELSEDAAIGGPASFGEDADGEVYITMLTGDAVYRIAPQ